MEGSKSIEESDDETHISKFISYYLYIVICFINKRITIHFILALSLILFLRALYFFYVMADAGAESNLYSEERVYPDGSGRDIVSMSRSTLDINALISTARSSR